MQSALTIDDLRRYAVARTLFAPTTLRRAIDTLGFQYNELDQLTSMTGTASQSYGDYQKSLGFDIDNLLSVGSTNSSATGTCALPIRSAAALMAYLVSTRSTPAMMTIATGTAPPFRKHRTVSECSIVNGIRRSSTIITRPVHPVR